MPIQSFKRLMEGGQISAKEFERLQSEVEINDRVSGNEGIAVGTNSAGIQLTPFIPFRCIGRIIGQPVQQQSSLTSTSDPSDPGNTKAAEGSAGGSAYSWRQQIPLDGGGFQDDPGGYVGTADPLDLPAYEMNGSTSVPVGTIVEMILSPTGDYFLFSYQTSIETVISDGGIFDPGNSKGCPTKPGHSTLTSTGPGQSSLSSTTDPGFVSLTAAPLKGTMKLPIPPGKTGIGGIILGPGFGGTFVPIVDPTTLPFPAQLTAFNDPSWNFVEVEATPGGNWQTADAGRSGVAYECNNQLTGNSVGDIVYIFPEVELPANPNRPVLTTVPQAGGVLDPNTDYYYAVTSVDGSGKESLPSFVSLIHTTAANRTASLTWPAVPGAASYKIYRSLGDSSTIINPNGGTIVNNGNGGGTIVNNGSGGGTIINKGTCQAGNTYYFITVNNNYYVDSGNHGPNGPIFFPPPEEDYTYRFPYDDLTVRDTSGANQSRLTTLIEFDDVDFEVSASPHTSTIRTNGFSGSIQIVTNVTCVNGTLTVTRQTFVWEDGLLKSVT